MLWKSAHISVSKCRFELQHYDNMLSPVLCITGFLCSEKTVSHSAGSVKRSSNTQYTTPVRLAPYNSSNWWHLQTWILKEIWFLNFAEYQMKQSLNERKWSVNKYSEVKWSVVGWGLNERKWSADKYSEVKCSWVKFKWEKVKCRQL
jgi:hypothetical protein